MAPEAKTHHYHRFEVYQGGTLGRGGATVQPTQSLLQRRRQERGTLDQLAPGLPPDTTVLPIVDEASFRVAPAAVGFANEEYYISNIDMSWPINDLDGDQMGVRFDRMSQSSQIQPNGDGDLLGAFSGSFSTSSSGPYSMALSGAAGNAYDFSPQIVPPELTQAFPSNRFGFTGDKVAGLQSATLSTSWGTSLEQLVADTDIDSLLEASHTLGRPALLPNTALELERGSREMQQPPVAVGNDWPVNAGQGLPLVHSQRSGGVWHGDVFTNVVRTPAMHGAWTLDHTLSIGSPTMSSLLSPELSTDGPYYGAQSPEIARATASKCRTRRKQSAEAPAASSNDSHAIGPDVQSHNNTILQPQSQKKAEIPTRVSIKKGTGRATTNGARQAMRNTASNKRDGSETCPMPWCERRNFTLRDLVRHFGRDHTIDNMLWGPEYPCALCNTQLPATTYSFNRHRKGDAGWPKCPTVVEYGGDIAQLGAHLLRNAPDKGLAALVEWQFGPDFMSELLKWWEEEKRMKGEVWKELSDVVRDAVPLPLSRANKEKLLEDKNEPMAEAIRQAKKVMKAKRQQSKEKE